MKRLTLLCVILLILGCNALAQAPTTPTNPESQVPGSPTSQLPTKCDGKNFPKNSPSCCQLGNDLFLIGRFPGQPLKENSVAHRRLGLACSDGQGNTHCVGTACVYGPCGAHIEHVWYGNRSEVFVPASQPNVCGYQTKLGTQVIVQVPEPYIHQTLYPPVTASCPYTTCLDGGISAVTLTVTAITHDATGHVDSNPAGIAISGAGSKSVAMASAGGTPPTVAILTAVPSDNNTRVKFSGGASCNKVGDFGIAVSCTVLLAPDPKVTVGYECRPGSTCKH